MSGYDVTTLTPEELEVTDGPFRNADLASRWRKFGDSADSDATSRDERTEQAQRALSKDLSTEFRALVQEIDRFVRRPQQDLLARSAVEAIFEKHPRSPLADTLQRFFSANLARPMAIDTAWTLALDSTIQREQHNIRNRMVEEAMHARTRKDLPGDRYITVVERMGEALDGVSIPQLREDVLINKTPPRAALIKKSGIDDGPSI